MKLAELHLGGFGKFEDLTLVFPSDFTLILGANEAGKTTVADAFPGVLFGFRRSLKHFRDRYRPWRGGRYTASLLLMEGDGKRYLLGRDFEHDRIELFRGQGVRLEPIPEAELAAILHKTLGFENPLLFDSTILLRRQESGLFKRDRAAFWALAEALGLTPMREEIRNEGGYPEVDRPVRAGTMQETTASTTPQEGNGDFRALFQERDRVSGLAAALAEEDRLLEERLGRLEELRARFGEREKLEDELREVRARLVDLEEDSSTRPGGNTVAQAEELANRISSLEVELRYEEEGIHQYEMEIDLLEMEISLTRTKLEGLDAYHLSPDVQGQLSQRLPLVNEHTTRLGELFPAVDRLAERLKRLRALRYAGLGLGFIAALGGIGFYGHLPASYSLGGSGLAAATWLGTLALLIWSKNLYRRFRSLNTEIESREAELKELRAAIEHLLHGKTLVQYQAELEAKRLYERDLWHLEQTLAQKKAEKEPAESVERIKKALEEAKEELARLLAAAGCQDLAEIRSKAAQRQEAVEALRAREETLLERLKEFSALPAALDQNEQAALAAKQDEIRARLEEARISLAELEAEIARRKASPEGRNGCAEAPIETPTLPPREPAVAVERVGLDPGLTARMEEILAEITGGRYERIRLEFGPTGLALGVESREAGRFLEPANLSAGSLAQVRLAMHVAFTERLTGNTNPPFLLDDPFADLDEERLRSTLSFLGRISQDRQIVFFTRQREIARMLAEAGITPAVIELGVG